MLFNTHLLFGLFFFMLLKDFFSGGNEIIFLLLVLLGSILPDLDSGKSKINRWSGFLGIILGSFLKHRGILHSVFFVIFIFVLANLFLGNYYAFGLLIGVLAHLSSDSLTPGGIKFFYPLSKMRIRGPIKVGGVGEWLVFVGLIFLIIKEFL